MFGPQNRNSLVALEELMGLQVLLEQQFSYDLLWSSYE